VEQQSAAEEIAKQYTFGRSPVTIDVPTLKSLSEESRGCTKRDNEHDQPAGFRWFGTQLAKTERLKAQMEQQGSMTQRRN